LKKSNLPNLVAPKKPMGRGEGPTTPMDFGQVSQYFLNGKFSPQKSLEKELSWVLKDTHTHTQNQNFTATPLELTPDFLNFSFPLWCIHT
jgi:hypothetical protein